MLPSNSESSTISLPSLTTTALSEVEMLLLISDLAIFTICPSLYTAIFAQLKILTASNVAFPFNVIPFPVFTLIAV